MSETLTHQEMPPVNPGFEFFKLVLLILISVGVGWASSAKLGIGLWPGVVIAACIFGVCLFSMIHLRGAPPEIGYTFGLKFFSVMAYKVMNFTLVMWLANDIGIPKEYGLTVVFCWAIVMSISTLLAGSLSDALGLRKTLLLGVSICVLARLVMVATSNQVIALGAGLLPLAIGEALCTPVLVVALRKFSTASQRSVAFSVFYAIMNFGFMVGYFVSDGVQKAAGDDKMFTLDFAFFSGDFSVYRMMLLASTGVELLMFPLILMLRRGAEMTANGMVITPEEDKHPGYGFVEASWLTVKEAANQTLSVFSGLVRTPGFHRLIIFLLLIGFLKVVFNVMDYVLPPFALKELGSMETVGRLNAINGVLILVLAPAIGILTQKYSAYSMVIMGGLVTAGSFVFMFLPSSAFQGMADGWVGNVIGHHYLKLVGAVSPWYVMIAFWQVMFSIGEAFYSPRVYEYASSIAPRGQEASYASLSYVPLLIGKLITALLGFLGVMAWMCPEEGPGNPQLAWLMIGLMVLVAPVGLLVFKRFIQVKEEGRSS